MKISEIKLKLTGWLTIIVFFWTIKDPRFNLFWYIPPGWKTAYHKSHHMEKHSEWFTCEGPGAKWGGSPTIEAPLWQRLLGLFGNYRPIWKGYRLIFYLEVSSIVTVKRREKVVGFGNVCKLLFPDQIPEKKSKDFRHKGCFRKTKTIQDETLLRCCLTDDVFVGVKAWKCVPKIQLYNNNDNNINALIAPSANKMIVMTSGCMDCS